MKEAAWKGTILRGTRLLKTLQKHPACQHVQLRDLNRIVDTYSVYASDHYLGLIDPTDPDCPILKQVLPQLSELETDRHEATDPIGDEAHRVRDGLIHRYENRVLAMLTHACPIMCRFCFRKVFLNEESSPSFAHTLAELEHYLMDHKEVDEVIFSGGDPFMLSDRKLLNLMKSMARLENVRTLRFHTRVIAAMPQRVTPALLTLLKAHPNVVIVAHINHPRELSDEARDAIHALRRCGIRVFSQTVLLKGVNAALDILTALFHELSAVGCTPYYLHHTDQTVGTQHFRVPVSEGLAIYRGLRGRLPGYSIPEYVLDLPGGHGKIPLDGNWLEATLTPGIYTWRSPKGNAGIYRDLAVPAACPDQDVVLSTQ